MEHGLLDRAENLGKAARPLGEFAELTKRGVPITGTENYGGSIVTAGGLVFIGGTVADRVDRRRLLALTQGLTALLFGGLGVLVTTGLVEIWQVMIMAFLLGCVRAFDQPSRQGSVDLGMLDVDLVLQLELAQRLNGLEQSGGEVHLPLFIGES